MQNRPILFHQNFSKPHRLGFCALAILLLIAIVFLSLGKAQHTNISFNNIDKVAHGFAYFVLGLVAIPALGKVRTIFIWAGLSLFGIGLEIAQGIMKIGRQADVVDALANASGALLAVLVWVMISFWIARLKTGSQAQ